jgi:DNA-binding transcriptional ArsR family regulator
VTADSAAAEAVGTVAEMAEATSSVLRALAHPTRREMVRLLRTGDLTAGELATPFDGAASTLSEHIAVLRRAGLVHGARRGSSITYTLDVPVLEETLRATMDLFDLWDGHDHA